MARNRLEAFAALVRRRGNRVAITGQTPRARIWRTVHDCRGPLAGAEARGSV
jgi:hypothetical protein